MKFNHLRDVVAVGETRSLRAAARLLGLAQPSITRSIAEAERALGAPIFERHARGVNPTAVGERFLVRAAAVLAELDRARDEAAQIMGIGGGRVSVVLSSVPHLAFYPSALKSFQARFPDVRLSVNEGLFPNRRQAIEDGEVDFYIGPLTEGTLSPGLHSELLMDNERMIFGRRGHPRRKAKSLRDLVGANWITTTLTGDMATEIGPIFEAHDLPAPNVRLQVQSSMTMIISLISSDLLVVLPRQWIGFELTSHAIEPIRIKESLAAPPIYAVRRQHFPLTPAAQFLYDMLLRAAKNYQREANEIPRDST